MANQTLPLIASQNPGVPVVSTDIFLARQVNPAIQNMDSAPTAAQIKTFCNTSVPVVLASVAGINAFSVTNTLIYTVPTGKTLIVTGLYPIVTAANATAGPSIGLGTASGTNNIYAAQATGAAFITPNALFIFPVAGGSSVAVPAGGTVYLNNTVAATGTSEVYTANLVGFLI